MVVLLIDVILVVQFRHVVKIVFFSECDLCVGGLDFDLEDDEIVSESLFCDGVIFLDCGHDAIIFGIDV